MSNWILAGLFRENPILMLLSIAGWLLYIVLMVSLNKSISFLHIFLIFIVILFFYILGGRS